MNNIYDIMLTVNGASFVGLDTKTVPDLLGGKANPMKGNVAKYQEGSSVMVFQNKTCSSYGNMVERRLKKEGKDPKSFSLGPRRFGTRIPNTPFIEHNGQYYLEVIFLKPGKVTYMYEGNRIKPADITGFKERPESSHQGGLSDKVIIRIFKIESLIGIRINGEQYNNLYFEMPQSTEK